MRPVVQAEYRKQQNSNLKRNIELSSNHLWKAKSDVTERSKI